MSNIREELKPLSVSIGSVHPHPRNVRQGDIGAIIESLTKHGQYRPIVVHKATGDILAGNHTYAAATALGWKDIAVTMVDCDEEQALRILLTDNRANDLASYDDNALADLLKELMTTEEQLAGTMFDPADLDDLLGLLEPPNLDDLIGSLGGEHDNDDHDDFSGIIRLRVALSIFSRWETMWKEIPGTSDDEKVTYLLDSHDSHR
jgi:ParB-like chromosome segregation protein Spo0J